jgi:hypothetical protein
LLTSLLLQTDAYKLTGCGSITDVNQDFAFLTVDIFAAGGGRGVAGACTTRACCILLFAVNFFKALLNIFLKAECLFPYFKLAFGDHGIGVFFELNEVEAF